jgi:hypothetical protein
MCVCVYINVERNRYVCIYMNIYTYMYIICIFDMDTAVMDLYKVFIYFLFNNYVYVYGFFDEYNVYMYICM